ncbi:putative disease resistance protein RGA3 [Coffea eugenioides]|uniref:putative disease resistance protein RGA3 n=1 Tax=Coffea eugenioides TaxID=49369 RepID=UPI000F60FE6B|nr:putative disease resistance protein RGA3 [Coffea eugenioides]
MKHLRHLDMSQTRIAALPDSITKLYNLMTLKVRYLLKIPKKFSNLINLRHLEFSSGFGDGHRCLFPGIGQLANLRTLPHFRVSQDKGCQLEELEHLRNLRGELKIFGLENVSSFESAAKAKLSEKSSIQSLTLEWDRTKEDCDDDNINSVMEGLQPRPDLKSLAIDGFKGSRLPSWMVAKDHVTVLLRNLVHLRLEKLARCEQVPSLGDLPCLESLEMVSLHNVKRIGAEFYGLDINARRSASCSNRDGKPVTLFPKLSSFALCGMKSLEEWSDAMVPSDFSSSIKVFPNLRDLRISWLPKLAVLPDMENLTSVTKLRIWECRSLACLRNLNSLTSLESLSIDDCPALLDASLDMKNPQSLRKLTISGCDKLNPSLSNNLEKLTSLRRLRIFSDDPGSWPIMGLHHLANLRELELGGGFSDILDLDHFPWPHSITNLVSLEHLGLRGWPKITSLPDQIQHLSNLKILSIEEFEGLEVLPEWMGSLRNLRQLVIGDCSNLRQLPSAEAMRHLTNLNYLSITRCPLLAERCTEGSGAEWPKIAHIPEVDI